LFDQSPANSGILHHSRRINLIQSRNTANVLPFPLASGGNSASNGGGKLKNTPPPPMICLLCENNPAFRPASFIVQLFYSGGLRKTISASAAIVHLWLVRSDFSGQLTEKIRHTAAVCDTILLP
jgi:hypothetical protein